MCWTTIGLILVIPVGIVPTETDHHPQEPTSKQEAAIEPASSPSFRQLFQGAQTKFRQGNYQEATELAVAAIKLQPQNPQIHLLMADLRFISGDVTQAIESYDEVIKLQPESKPYLWQRGLALYYAGKFAEGKSQFETHQTVNSQDVENAVWHLLCAAHIDHLDSARKKLIPIERDTRVPMKEIYELFAGRISPADVIRAAQSDADNRLPLYYAQLYIGLYHEMLGQKDASAEAIRVAVQQSPNTKDNLMLQLARIHHQLRAGPSQAKSPETKDKRDDADKSSANP